MTIDERISSELRRHAPDVDEHAAWERIQSAAPARHSIWARRLVPVAVGALGVVVLAVTLIQTFPWDPAPVANLESPFRGTWYSTDLDGSNQTMVIQVSGEGVVEVVIEDDSASVCSGAASTTTGTVRLESETVLVIPTPALTCEDGNEPESLNGESLEGLLADLTLVHQQESDTLTDSGLTWSRERPETPQPEPTAQSMWPQSSLEEVEEAQELADAGDPDYTWQLAPEIVGDTAPGDAEIFRRLFQLQIGWDEYRWGDDTTLFWGGDCASLAGCTSYEVGFLHCDVSRINPVYPKDAEGSTCAPTIDEATYETVVVRVEQLATQGASGIWVVTGWHEGAPFTQVVPQRDEAAALVEEFLQARIDGAGAEQYIDVPLLYETGGARYERFEFEQVAGPRWPLGSMEFTVRLFTGDTVVEQHFTTPEGGGLGLEYGSRTSDVPSTTVNGQPLPEPDDVLHDGQVILYAPHPWRHTWMNDHGLIREQGSTRDEIQVLADPVPVGTGCEAGPAQADAEALAESIQSDPDFEATAPVAVNLGGVEALTMDVVAASGASVCDYFPAPLVLSSLTDQLPGSMDLAAGSRMRLYLLDLPEGLTARTLAIAVIVSEGRFESVVEEIAPILDSIEFHAK